MYELPKTQLGSTELIVPQIGLGTAPLGDLYHSAPEAEAVETIQYAFEQGINYFDTAPLYGHGIAEKRLGTALAGQNRDQFIISTKVGYTENGTWDWSRAGIYRSIEGSLERLKCHYFDILLLHDPDYHYNDALNQAYPVLAELRRQGHVKAIGAGMNQWQMLADFARYTDVDCLMLAGRYSLLEQGALSFLELCYEKKIGVLLAGVFNSGILATGAIRGAKYDYYDAPPQIIEKTRRLASLCQRFSIPLAAASLQFPLGHPAITSLVVGCSSPDMIYSNLANHKLEIPQAFWIALREEDLLGPDIPTPQ